MRNYLLWLWMGALTLGLSGCCGCRGTPEMPPPPSAEQQERIVNGRAQFEREEQRFQAALVEPLADHVAARVVFDGSVQAVRSVQYCPFRTANCGDNPTCDHPQKTRMEVIVTPGNVMSAEGEFPNTPKSFFIPIYQGDYRANDKVKCIAYWYVGGAGPQPGCLVNLSLAGE